MTILCYKEDNLIQAVEFIEFKSKMESSLNKRYAESIQRFNKIIDFDSIEDILSLNESLANLSVQEEQLHLLSDFKAVSCRLETHSKYFNLPSLHLSKFTNHIGCEETFDSRQDGIIKQIKLYEILTQLIFLILNGEVSSLVNSLNHLSNHLSFFGIQNNLVEKTCDAAPEDVIWSFLTAMLKLATDFLLVNEEVECHNVEVSRDISSITTRLNEVSTRLRPLLELWLNLKERICQNASVDEFRISKSVSEIVTMTHLTTRLNLRILALISSTLNGSILLSRKNLIKKLRKLGLSQDEMDSLIPVYLRLKEEFSSFVQGILLAAENIRDTLYRLVTRPFADIKFHSSIFQEENVRAYSITTYYAMIECQRNSIRDVNYSLAKAIEKLKLHK